MNNENNKPEFLFDKVNYKILLVGLAVIALGFILMSGGGSEDPNVFNEAIFSFRRIWNYNLFDIKNQKKIVFGFLSQFSDELRLRTATEN
jgi:hypothetical protein